MLGWAERLPAGGYYSLLAWWLTGLAAPVRMGLLLAGAELLGWAQLRRLLWPASARVVGGVVGLRVARGHNDHLSGLNRPATGCFDAAISALLTAFQPAALDRGTHEGALRLTPVLALTDEGLREGAARSAGSYGSTPMSLAIQIPASGGARWRSEQDAREDETPGQMAFGAATVKTVPHIFRIMFVSVTQTADGSLEGDTSGGR